MKRLLHVVFTLLISIMLVGCAQSAQGEDTESVEIGLNDVAVAENENMEQTANKTKANIVEASSNEAYTYADFKGIYAMYEGVPFESEVVATTILSDDYLTDIVVEWMEYTVADIASVTVEENVLSLDYEGKEEGPLTYPAGTFIAQLDYDENGDRMLMINGHTFYPLTRDQFNALDLTVDEALFTGL